MPIFLIISEIYGCKKYRNGEKFKKNFELFGPPCRNALTDLDGSTLECAQVCALHTGLHLASLREIEKVAVLFTKMSTLTPKNVQPPAPKAPGPMGRSSPNYLVPVPGV